jgi:hypothetical protein
MERGRIWINNHFMDEVEQLARAATQDSWWWAKFEGENHEDMVQFVATGLAGSDSTRLNVIAVGTEGQPDYRMVAYTGNGPTSAANSEYVMAVQPRSLLTLIAYVRDLQQALHVHTEDDDNLLSCPTCDWDIESYVERILDKEPDKRLIPFWCPHCCEALAVQTDGHEVEIRFYEDVREDM